jgi:hypothetical protein
MGRGGARCGAGRPGYKVLAGQVPSLDVRALARLGYVNGDCSFSWRWLRGCEPAGSVGIEVQARMALSLNYTIAQNGQAHTVTERVGLTYTPCHYGGARAWLLCPRCGRRVARLFMRAGRFACRHCQRVAYASQSHDAVDRLWGRQQKIEAKLGENWQRPKGMRQRTYERLLTRLQDCELRRENALVHAMARLFGARGDAAGQQC